MMSDFSEPLSWIDSQEQEMRTLVKKWAEINSGSTNLAGLSTMLLELEKAFAPLGDQVEKISLSPRQIIESNGTITQVPLGQALLIRKRIHAPFRLFLGGHMDTVYPKESPFQRVIEIDSHALSGPGVADMKGGLVVMLKALEALQRSNLVDQLGWDILINPDEEIGSIGSSSYFSEYAKHCHVGLLFEPSLPNGAIITERKGSAVYTITFKGKAAHAGRDVSLGRNAIHALTKFIYRLIQSKENHPEISLNTGFISGGGAVNVIPEFALCRINARWSIPPAMVEFENTLKSLKESVQKELGVEITIHSDSYRPPKPFSSKTQQLYKLLYECGQEIGIHLKNEATGGVCDGNILAEAGLPTLDSLGVRGGSLHSMDEYIELDSLTERARLAALFIMKLTKQGIN